jgi:hypothetical protein
MAWHRSLRAFVGADGQPRKLFVADKRHNEAGYKSGRTWCCRF